MTILKTLAKSKRLFFVLLIVLFVCLMIINNAVLRNARIDLTENSLYTLSEGTHNLLAKIKQPLNFYLFFSQDAAQDYPQIKNYYLRVKEMLEEYRLYSNGNLKIHYITPEPFSEDEDRATQMGVQAVQVKGGGTLYFGLAATNSVDDIETIPFFQMEKEVLLEYELGQLIYSLMRLDKPVLGLMTTLNMYPSQINPQTGGVNQAWVITDELEKLFDVRLVHSDTTVIEDEIDVLMVVHPKDTKERKPYLPEATLYAIDQFVMRKGKGIFFVDPFSNAEYLPVPQDQPLQDAKAKSSSLNPLFRKWGFEVDENSIIGDRQLALQTRDQQGRNVRNISILGTRTQQFDTKDPVMTSLQTLNFAMASHIKPSNKPEEVTIVPLVQTSRQAGPILLNRFRFLGNPMMLQQGFQPADKHYTLAARIRGNINSAYTQAPNTANEGQARPMAAHLSKAVEAVELVVVADTDILSDPMWVQAQNFFGQRLIRPFASNGDFVGNIIENLLGSSDLINIRSRASYSRPFTRIDEIERTANQKYRETAEQLQRELNQIEQRLQQLQQQRSDQQNTILTQQQLNELNNAKAKRTQVRKQLRNVLHQQNKDIENLGFRLKLINIGGIPLLVGLLALIIGWIRISNRKHGSAGSTKV